MGTPSFEDNLLNVRHIIIITAIISIYNDIDTPFAKNGTTKKLNVFVVPQYYMYKFIYKALQDLLGYARA